MSKLFVATKELTTKDTIQRRFADVCSNPQYLIFLNSIPNHEKQTDILICESVFQYTVSNRAYRPVAAWQECPLSGFKDPSSEKQTSKPADDPRANIAIARTNWIHSKYKIVRLSRFIIWKTIQILALPVK